MNIGSTIRLLKCYKHIAYNNYHPISVTGYYVENWRNILKFHCSVNSIHQNPRNRQKILPRDGVFNKTDIARHAELNRHSLLMAGLKAMTHGSDY